MAPTVRANCDNIYCFGQLPPGAKWAVDSYGDEFSKVADLPDGYFIHKAGRGQAVTGCAWYKKNGVFVKA